MVFILSIQNVYRADSVDKEYDASIVYNICSVYIVMVFSGRIVYTVHSVSIVYIVYIVHIVYNACTVYAVNLVSSCALHPRCGVQSCSCLLATQ